MKTTSVADQGPSLFAVAYLVASVSFTSLGVILLIMANSRAGGLF